MKITEDQWKEAREWRAKGMTQKEIAGRLGVSQVRVSQKLGARRKKHGMDAPLEQMA